MGPHRGRTGGSAEVIASEFEQIVLARGQSGIDKAPQLSYSHRLMFSFSGARSRYPLAVLLLCIMAFGSAARANWLVFELRFTVEPDASINFAPYTGAYVIAPIDGGTTSYVFTTEVDGRFYSVAHNSGRYFIAAGSQGRRAVLSAVAQNGSGMGMYLASGALNSTFPYFVNGARKAAIVPTDLAGQLMAADDESTAVKPGDDGSIGMAGSAAIKGTLRLDLSRILNQKPMTMLDAIESITALLEKYAYLPDGTVAAPATADAPQPEPQPSAPPAETTETSLFPAGSKEEMERQLKLQNAP